MSSSQPSQDAALSQSGKTSRTDALQVFRPLALPALAAAVLVAIGAGAHALKTAPTRRFVHEDEPQD